MWSKRFKPSTKFDFNSGNDEQLSPQQNQITWLFLPHCP